MKRERLLLALVLLLLHEFCLGRSPPVSDEALKRVAASLPKFVDPLPRIPKLLGYAPGLHGRHRPGALTIGMYKTKWKFHRDFPETTVFAYGASRREATVPGPLIEALRGVPTYVRWENHLPKKHILPWDPTILTAKPRSNGVPTVVHLHGGINPPTSDGNPLAWFTSNFSERGPAWTQSTYMYPNAQHAGNLWYHDHALGLTRVNLLAGLFAPYRIIDPELEEKFNLPSGPEFDHNLVVFDRSFYADGSLYINRTGNVPQVHPQWQPEYFGHAIIVNGKAWPYLEVRRRRYRFRITNASNARYLSLSLTNGLSFIVIGSDGSYLPRPVTSSTVLVAPAETFDVVIDFGLSAHGSSILTNDAAYPFPSGDPVDELNSQIMKFIITEGPSSIQDTSTVPRQLHTYTRESAAKSATKADKKRYIGLYEYTNSDDEPLRLYINGKRFTDAVTETPRIGSTEIWEVINLTEDNHPLHIHLTEVQAVKVQSLKDPGKHFTKCMTAKSDAVACNISSYATGGLHRVPEQEKTWKNVVKIAPGNVTTVVVKFNMVDGDRDYPFDATLDPGYVYHCHILDHEDNQMVRPLKLLH